MPKYLFTKVIEDAIIAGIRECGEDIFNMSQYLVPVATGKLKRSGKIKKIAKGIQITYTSDHASPVEFGTGHRRESVKKHWVRQHFRRYIHKHAIRNVRTGKRTTHQLGPITNRKGSLYATINPVHIKVKLKNKVLVKGHDRGPFSRYSRGMYPRRYFRTAIDNIYPDVVQYIENYL